MQAIWNPSSVNRTREVYTPTAASVIATRTSYILTNSGRWLPADPFAQLGAVLDRARRRTYRDAR
jgi:hypothetical protein